MNVDLSQIPFSFFPANPNWEEIRAWIDEQVDSHDRFAAWAKVVDQWLAQLNQAFGNHYETTASPGLVLFAPRNYEHSKLLLKSAAAGLGRIAHSLGDLADLKWPGPLAILLFDSPYDFQFYIAGVTCGWSQAPAAGMCLRSGYVHVAIHPGQLDQVQRTLLHELTHACFSHLSLPVWLEEGITQVAEEDAVPHWTRLAVDTDSAVSMRTFWRSHGLSEFWWGSGFHAADEVQGRCYELAQVLFRSLARDYKGQLKQFVMAARVEDAGESAAHEHFGKSVAELVSGFLGEGDWEPVPPTTALRQRRAEMSLAQNHYELALRDLEAILQTDRPTIALLLDRAFAYTQLGNHAAAINDYEQVIKLESQHPEANIHLAWLLATAPEDHLRDGKRARQISRRACESTCYGTWYYLETLAAACAEDNDIDGAEKWAMHALELAPESEAAGCQARLDQYLAGHPCRDVTAMVRHQATTYLAE